MQTLIEANFDCVGSVKRCLISGKPDNAHRKRVRTGSATQVMKEASITLMRIVILLTLLISLQERMEQSTATTNHQKMLPGNAEVLKCVNMAAHKHLRPEAGRR